MATETGLTQRHEEAISRLIGDYSGADPGVVREIYMGIVQNSRPNVANSTFGFPETLTRKELERRGFRRGAYKPI
ncbi:MAG: hypothetical protein HYT72_00250 [Candidatus Aenigmarchaeota archaeon]|nr:hypothetical protein [Candidatus Aenigmarchaeota archaeon]